MRSFTQKLMMFMAALMCSVSMSVSAQVLNEGFEDSSFPPDDWSTIHVRGVVEWTRNTSYKHAGEASAKANYDSSTGHENYLVTPKLTPAAGDTLSFFVAAQQYSATTLSIEVSTTDATAASFTTVLATYTTGSSGTIGTTSTSTWVEKRFPMDDYVGQDIFIAFHITDDNGSAVYIDDVTGVTLHVVTCPKPATIAVSDITNESATLSWAAGGSETQWQYVLTDANAAADWTTATTINQPSVTLTGLTANTAYDFHVRAYCSQAEQSDARLTSFRTTCDAITAFPWSEDFEAMAQNSEIDAPCWSNEHITGNGGYRFRSYSLASTGNNTRMCQLPDMSAGTITDLTLPAMNIPEANAYELILTMYRSANYGSYTNEGLRILALNGSDTAVLAFISRNPTQAYVVDETVIIPSEENVGWYTYNLTIPYSGFTSIVIRGESQYGAATYFDNLIVREKPSCTQPATLTASDVTAHGATLTWTTEGTETQFQYAVMPKDTAVDWTGATTVEVAEEKTAIVTGLTANTAYDIYLRAYCSESDQSEARMVSITTLPSCFVPTMPIISDITTVGATFTWEAGNGETEFQYVVMPKDTVVDWTGATLTNATTLTIAVLSANTAYDFYVRAYCSESDQSEAVKVTFRTECEVLATFPWSEDFEEVATGNIAIPCWKNEHIAGTGTQLFKVTTNSSSGNSTHLGQLPDMYSGTITDLSLPEMNIPAANAYEFIISEYRNATGSSYPEEGLRILALNGTDTFELAFISRNYTQAYMVAETVVIPVETASGWYTYNLAIPCSGNVRIIVRGESKYGSSTYFDNLMVREIPSCVKPTALTVADSTITMNSASLSWLAGGSETAWKVRYMAAGDEDWTVVDATTNTFVLNGLQANTAYTAEVAAACGENISDWSTAVNFRTACGIYAAATYEEGFEGDGLYCWTVGNAQSTSTSYIPSVGTTYKRTGDKGLHINAYVSGSVNADSAYAILPAMDYGTPGLTGYTLKFYARSSSTGSSYYKHLFVGVVTDPNDISTFELVQDVEVTADTYAELPFEVILGSYAGTGTRLALLTTVDPTASGYRYGHIYVDDISIVRTPTCQPLAKVEATNVERRNITVTLFPKAGLELGTNDLVYSTTELDNAALEAADKVTVATPTYKITGLDRETTYYIYVRANCGEGDVSAWVSTSATTKGLTLCDNILEIGDGTSNDYGPMCGYYGYERNGYIYTPADGLTAGNIGSIAWNYYSAATIPAKIYVKNTEATEFETTLVWNEIIADATLVYDNTVALTTGWNTFDFNAPFAYTGGNLMVLVESNYGGSGGGTAKAYYTNTTDATHHFYIRKDSSIDDTQAYSTFNTKAIDGKRHNVRFGQCYAINPCPTVTEMTSELLNEGTTEARISWTAADADYLSAYEVVRSLTEIEDFSEVTATVLAPDQNSIEYNDLVANTTYYVYVRAICAAEGHNEGSSNWVGISFTTNDNCPTLNGLALSLTATNAFRASWNTAYEEQALSFRYILSTSELDAAGIAAATPVLVDTNVIVLDELLNDQLYYFYVASACGASTSTYIFDSIKTPVACQAVVNLEAARVEHNLALITWNKAPFATETAWEIGFVGDEENAIVVTETQHMFIALTPETAYTVYVKALCSETSESAIATVSFTTGTQPGNCATVGTGTSAAYLLYTSYGNTYSQHIYTAEELAALGYGAGTINSVAFDYSGTSSTYEKTQSVYIGTTQQTSYTGANAADFIGDLTLVYGPTLLSYEAGWREYTFETPFVWDGTSNIVIGMLSNSTDGSSNGWGTRGTSTSPDYRTIYRYRDNTPIDIDNLSAVSSGSRSTTRPNIQFCFEPKTCPDVKALTVGDITATSATATWEPVGQETSWNVFVSPTQVEDPASIAGYATVNVMTYAMSNLMVDQDYWIYVQPVCTGADSWRVATFRTVATCFPPTALVASNITATTATIAWTDERDVNDYTAIYGPTATFNPADPSTYETADAIDTFAVISNLLPYTNYSFAVRSNCSDMNSRFGAAATFKTAPGVPFEPVFTSTSVPADWSRLTGLASDAFAGTNPTTSTFGWSIIAPDTVIDAYHFRANIYGTGSKYWVVTPTMEVPAANEGEGYLLRVDLGLTPYSQTATNRANRNNGVDDKFMIIVQEMTETPVWSAENATVWSNDTTADFIYNEIPENGETYYVDMSKYAGKNIRIAFYGESTTSNADNYFHFGNISLDRAIVNVDTVDACQTDPEEEIGTFTTEEYAPATETSLQIYTKTFTTVYESINHEELIETAYVGDHYVDRFYDFYVQLGDEEAYGFEEVSSHGCDSVWLVTFNQILEATTFNENEELAEGDTINWRGQEITEVGVYTDTVRSAMGGVKEIYILTVTAVVPPVQGRTFELVTTQLADWSGNYLIVFADNKAHSIVGGSQNKDLIATSDVLTITEDNKITTADTCFVTIEAMGIDGYSILLSNGNYLKRAHNGCAQAAEAEAMVIEYTENGIQISGEVAGKTGSYYLYCNANNGNPVYRFYVDKTGNTQFALPQLYKEVSGVDPGTAIETINTVNDAVKVILNGNLYIIRDNQWYDATGRMTVDPRK